MFKPRNSGSRKPASCQACRVKVDLLRNLDDLVDLDLQTLFDESTIAHDPDAIYKALGLVPDFDRNPNILTRFIICDQIVHSYLSNAPGTEYTNLCLLSGI